MKNLQNGIVVAYNYEEHNNFVDCLLYR